MSTEIPILYREIRKEFDKRMSNSEESGFVEKPRSLERLGKRRKLFVENSRRNNKASKEKLDEETTFLSSEYTLDRIQAMDLILRAWDIDERLKTEGAIFGNKSFNFALDRLRISQKDYEQTSAICLAAFRALQDLSNVNLKQNTSMNQTEMCFEELKLKPNAARIDLVLTEEGPKIIEINSQWVDAIGALAGFTNVFESPTKGNLIVENFAQCFPIDTKLAIINIAQTRGSREDGAAQELEILSKKLVNTKASRIRVCEVIDPNKVRLNYLDKFNCFYINCDPKYFGGNKPDWIDYLLERCALDPEIIFPLWRPSMDKKNVLKILSSNVNNGIAPTISLSQIDQMDLYNNPVVVKGDGYSLNAVAITGETNFEDFLGYAFQDPENYVVQPFLRSIKRDIWVYDTSSSRVRFIKDAYIKLNVWIVDGKVLGTLATFQNSPLISDKGYNTSLLVEGAKK